LTGELQAAHCLFGMPFSVYNGVDGQAGKELITLAKSLAPVGYLDIGKVKPAVMALASTPRSLVTWATPSVGGSWIGSIRAAATGSSPTSTRPRSSERGPTWPQKRVST